MNAHPVALTGRSTTAPRYDVVVVGGSIAGLAAAMAFCQRGVGVA